MRSEHFTLKDKIEAVLEHYDYCHVSNSGINSETKIVVNGTTRAILFRDLIIRFGPNRVSRDKGMVKVI